MAKSDAADRRYLFPFVCTECRKAFKRPSERDNHIRPCPVCGKPAIQVSRKFKAPKTDDREQWRKVQFLIAHGFLFQSIHDDERGGQTVPYPKTLSEAGEWVKKWAHLAIDPVAANSDDA